MKKRYSTTVKKPQSDKPKKAFLQSNNTYVTLCGLIFLSLLLISTCSPDTFSEDSSLITESSTNEPDRNLQDVDDIKDNIRNSYARLASERSDICPKLIQEDVGSEVVERTAEVMVNNYCDYFLYPRSGQNISVSINSSQIEALLIVPALHNFANGDYKVDSYDKHVIRLTYDGATYKPENFMYDVAVTISV
mgnify:FL=1